MSLAQALLVDVSKTIKSDRLVIVFRVPVDRSLRQGWWFVNSHQDRFFRMAAVPALCWLILKSLPSEAKASIASVLPMAPDQLAGSAVVLFGALWFRFAIKRARRSEDVSRKKRIDLGGLIRFVVRSAVIIVGVTALLTVPAVAISVGWIMIDRPASVTPEYASHVAGMALPIAVVLLSPVLIRLYAYYGAVIAGRHDVTPLDAWRWMKGKSMAFLALVLGALAPAVTILWAVEAMGLGLAGYVPAAAILFISVALMTGAAARAMNDLVMPPVVAGARP